MTTQELRIGNWVWNEVQNIPVKVDIRILQDQVYADKGFKEGWKPIPLTEEILLKAPPISKQEGYPYKFLKGYLKMRNGVFFYKYYGIEVELPYLHQLQNLYFANAGEDLKIEL